MAETVIAEIDLTLLANAPREDRRLREISRNPAARRDIAIVVDQAVDYRMIEQTIIETGGALLEDHWLFDVYEGKGIPEGCHSLAIALQFRKVGANFTDEEANQVRDEIVSALEALGAKLR